MVQPTPNSGRAGLWARVRNVSSSAQSVSQQCSMAAHKQLTFWLQFWTGEGGGASSWLTLMDVPGCVLSDTSGCLVLRSAAQHKHTTWSLMRMNRFQTVVVEIFKKMCLLNWFANMSNVIHFYSWCCNLKFYLTFALPPSSPPSSEAAFLQHV